MQSCNKQVVTCTIVREDGRRYEATNECDVTGPDCPRVAADCATGEGYSLCRPVHAEVRAALLAEDSSDIPGTAYISGHTYACVDCQHALRAVGVRTITFS